MKMKASMALAVAKRLVKAKARFDLAYAGDDEIILNVQHQASLDAAIRQEKQALVTRISEL